LSGKLRDVADRRFTEIEKDLQDTLSRIKGTKDPTLRHLLLRDMKLLLAEADELLLGKDPLPQIQSAARTRD